MEIAELHLSEAESLEDVDWNAVWKNRMIRRKGCAPDCASLWPGKKHARHYWKGIEELGKGWIDETMSELDVSPSSCVLDIGAGPGTLAIPLASFVSRITAVEPSPGMMGVLRENMEKADISNIGLVQKRWEDVNIREDLDPPYDIVVAAFSLDMPDLRKAIEKMVDVCSRQVFLYWYAGEPTWTQHYKTLWPALHGKRYQPSPRVDVILNLLYQMGIYPHTRVVPTEYPIRYSSIQEAIEQVRTEFSIKTEAQESILRDYLDAILVKENGSWFLHHSFFAVKVWWERIRPFLSR